MAPLTGIVEAHRFDATSIGGQSVATFPVPRNPDAAAATVSVHVEGESFRLNSMWVMRLPGRNDAAARVNPDPPRVVFAPTRPGTHKGSLIFEAKYADGTMTRYVTILVGESAKEAQRLDRKSGDGLLGGMSDIDIGEQVVGSRHTFPVPAPANNSTRSAVAKMRLEGDPAFAAKWGHFGTTVDLDVASPARPISLEFAPSKSGEYRGHLCVTANWHDGHVEERTAPIHARARALTEIAYASSAREETATGTISALPHVSPEVRTAAVDWDSAGAHEELGGALRGIFAFRRVGIGVIEHEQMGYKPPVLPRSLWWDLVEVAIALAGEAVGKVVERAVMSHVGKSLGVAMTKRAVSHSSAEGLGDAAEKLVTAKDIDSAAAAATKAIVSAVKTKAVSAGKGALPTAEQNVAGISASQSIAFFAEQQNILSGAEQTLTKQLLEIELGLRAMVGSNGGLANILVAGMAAGLRESQRGAQMAQMQETSAQWLGYKARAALGVEEASRDRTTVTVTKLVKAREFDKMEPPTSVGGLLDVHMARSGETWRVTGASVNGVSALVADRLLTMNLAGARIPIRFVLVNGAGYVTRDEAGRVRYSGFLHLDPDGQPGMPDETVELRGAQRIVDIALGRSLADWGIKSVSTDDEGSRS